jgi:hexosaminidase
MAPAPTLYLDHLQSDSPREPPGRPSLVTLQDVYQFEPVPAVLTPAEAARILGAQANAWTEHMRLPERIEHQAFPRAAALAEVTWSQAAARDWPGFLARVGAQQARYRKLGIRFADTAFEPRARIEAGRQPDRLRVALEQQTGYGELRYTLDGSPPTPGSLSYSGPFEAREGETLQAAAFDGPLLLAQMPPLALDRKILERRTDEQLRHCSGKLVLRLEDDAPLAGERAVFNVDIVDPCWIWTDADLSRGGRLSAAVGQLPFNFQIGNDELSIRRGDARTPAGELELFDGECRGEPLALVPLGAAAHNPAVTVIGPVRIPPRAGHGDLCMRFARPAIDPIWAIQWIEISP